MISERKRMLGLAGLVYLHVQLYLQVCLTTMSTEVYEYQ